VEAIVLVGGQGTRLRPLTVNLPKPLLPVAGVPFLTHQLLRAKAAGVEHVVLATSYRSELFAAQYGDGSRLGLRLDYVTETEPLGTGGGIRNVAAMLDSGPDDPVLVLNGDVLSGHDVRAQVDRHRAEAAAVTLHIVRVEDPRAFGSVPTDADDRVIAFVEKSPEPVSDQINAGCYVFARRVIDAIPADTVVSVERETFPALLAAGETVLAFRDDAYWLDVGTPASYVRAGADVVRGVIASPAVPEPADAIVRTGAEVAADAELTGGTCVDTTATVGAGSRLEGCVVMPGAVVGAGVVASRSVIGAGARIGTDTVLDEAIVGDGARVGARNELRAGVRIWPDVVLPDGAVRFSTDA
jgi:mannose-1-phosphate guanylyltransferase